MCSGLNIATYNLSVIQIVPATYPSNAQNIVRYGTSMYYCCSGDKNYRVYYKTTWDPPKMKPVWSLTT